MVQTEKNVRNRTAKPALGNKGLVDKLYHRTQGKAVTRKAGSSIAVAFHACGKQASICSAFSKSLKSMVTAYKSKRETAPVECMELDLAMHELNERQKQP